MSTERAASMRLIKIGGIALVALLISAYALARSFAYAQGPSIRLFEPADGAAIASSSVVIRGQADRVNALSIDGLPMSMDTAGHFQETVVIFPGMNAVTISATDQFKRRTERVLRLYGQADFPVSSRVILEAASTSTASTTR